MDPDEAMIMAMKHLTLGQKEAVIATMRENRRGAEGLNQRRGA
jgi:hypothetical protein